MAKSVYRNYLVLFKPELHATVDVIKVIDAFSSNETPAAARKRVFEANGVYYRAKFGEGYFQVVEQPAAGWNFAFAGRY